MFVITLLGACVLLLVFCVLLALDVGLRCGCLFWWFSVVVSGVSVVLLHCCGYLLFVFLLFVLPFVALGLLVLCGVVLFIACCGLVCALLCGFVVLCSLVFAVFGLEFRRFVFCGCDMIW